MAEDKKSFVLYADLLKSIDHLTTEEKGILFNHLLEFVNDKNPILEDRLILTAWKPIELQLKRDLIKYEDKKIERSISGRIGNLKRYYIDVYNLFNSGKITLEEGEKIAKSRKESLSDNKLANVADNDNDTVIVTDNDILLEKETKEIPPENLIEEDLVNPETEQRKKVAPKKEIEYPFPTKEFKDGWDLWKAYRKKKDKFQYFDEVSEKKALSELFNLSKTNEATALAIIRQSIDNGWKGFFELKNKTNGNNRPTTNGTPNLALARRR